MSKRFFNLVIILFLSNNLFAQQDFSLSKYFAGNPKVEEAIEFNQPNDRTKVEHYVKSLIETGNFNFPDIYGSNLTPNPPNWASYPDSILWNVYYAYAAFSIYIDYSNKVPWKLSDLTSEQLNNFFYTEYLFNSYWKYFGGLSTPTNPLFTYSFLIEKNLIGKTRKETIERLFQWSRYHMQHFLGGTTPENYVAHWQYNDGPPVERVITGTTFTDNGQFNHWSRGCGGATRFFANVLRVINIPVMPKIFGSHIAMDFPSEGLIMTHGDDPYGIMDNANDVEIHASEIFVPYSVIDSIIAVGFEGIEITRYGTLKVVAKHFPLWYYHPTDTSITYTAFSNDILNYTRSDTTEQYYQIINQARARYSAVDADRFNVIIDLFYSDSLWYKKVYGLNPNAYLDTVLIPYNIGYTEIKNGSIYVYVDESTTELSPVFFRNMDSFISIESDSIINLNNPCVVTVTAEDSLLAVTYPIIKNIVPRHNINITVTPEGAAECFGGGFYVQGTNATILAAPTTGYRFVKWTEADTLVSENSSFTFTVQNNRNFVAHFDTTVYMISVALEPENGGTVDGSGNYKHGSVAELTANPANGYNFVGWKENGNIISYELTISFIAEQNRNLIAEFAFNWYYVGLYANTSDGGTVTGEGWYPFGTNVTVTATPINDYIFINWTEDGTVVSNDPAYSFTATTDRNLIAHFLLTNSIIIATDDNHKFSIFPNPARDVLNIQFLRNENIINQIINIDVFNTLGKAVSVNYNLSSKEGVIIVPVTDIPAGLYFLDIQMNDKSVGKAKVIIIKKI